MARAVSMLRKTTATCRLQQNAILSTFHIEMHLKTCADGEPSAEQFGRGRSKACPNDRSGNAGLRASKCFAMGNKPRMSFWV